MASQKIAGGVAGRYLKTAIGQPCNPVAAINSASRVDIDIKTKAACSRAAHSKSSTIALRHADGPSGGAAGMGLCGPVGGRSAMRLCTLHTSSFCWVVMVRFVVGLFHSIYLQTHTRSGADRTAPSGPAHTGI